MPFQNISEVQFHLITTKSLKAGDWFLELVCVADLSLEQIQIHCQLQVKGDSLSAGIKSSYCSQVVT